MPQQHILLTFDVEDWFQVENLRQWNPPSTWDERELRIEHATHRILDLLDSISLSYSSPATRNPQPATASSAADFPASQPPSLTASNSSSSSNSRHLSHSSHFSHFNTSLHPLRATFFILGWIARRCPNLVREIQRRGHEVASHGDSHLLCTEMTQEGLARDLVQSKHMLEDLIGEEVIGYRAPSFSVSESILDQICAAGYTYDSSYNSFALNPRYGRMEFQDLPKKHGIIIQAWDGFFELPISNMAVGGTAIPWGGGGYFRLIPSWMFIKGVRKIVHTENAYVLYLHPWEFDPGQPRVRGVSWKFGFRHYVNLSKTGKKLERLIRSFTHCSFVSCTDYLRLKGFLT